MVPDRRRRRPHFFLQWRERRRWLSCIIDLVMRNVDSQICNSERVAPAVFLKPYRVDAVGGGAWWPLRAPSESCPNGCSDIQ
eukprot:1719146-Pyramimonas_sp.AAC.2